MSNQAEDRNEKILRDVKTHIGQLTVEIIECRVTIEDLQQENLELKARLDDATKSVAEK